MFFLFLLNFYAENDTSAVFLHYLDEDFLEVHAYGFKSDNGPVVLTHSVEERLSDINALFGFYNIGVAVKLPLSGLLSRDNSGKM